MVTYFPERSWNFIIFIENLNKINRHWWSDVFFSFKTYIHLIPICSTCVFRTFKKILIFCLPLTHTRHMKHQYKQMIILSFSRIFLLPNSNINSLGTFFLYCRPVAVKSSRHQGAFERSVEFDVCDLWNFILFYIHIKVHLGNS